MKNSTRPSDMEMRCRFKKKYASSNLSSADTKLELNTLTVPRTSSTSVMPKTASISLLQNFFRTSGERGAAAASPFSTKCAASLRGTRLRSDGFSRRSR